ncbi:ABC transporter ATP-binding protein [Microbacterium sp.]|uniref:ABC transporter ATP-binding protein n=1 Tax=Microbacterium sp. TaxID=51671 RepID=UPI002810B79D|nr:ABC transporter ATP-binding protein [Microbacterium sp.]
MTLRDVTKTFHTAAGPMQVVDSVSVGIEAGSFVSVIGPSGCGKTTVVRMVGDLLAPTSGQILIDDQPPAAARASRQFGFVFQRPTLVEWRSVLRNVTLPLDVLGWSKKAKEDRGRELLALVGLEDFADHRPDQISGGMQQRVAIARALSYDPGVLIMDEPFGALDLITRDRMGFELLRIHEEAGKTILFVTHSIDEAVLLSDKVLVMGPRPTVVQKYERVQLPRPRTPDHREDPTFIALSHELRQMLEPHD